jgi:hypothetical protein
MTTMAPQGDRLDWASLCVELRVQAFPFNIGYWEGPAYFDIAPVRILIHETIHFFQMLSMGFLTNLCLETWRSAVEFEKTGVANKYNDLQEELERRDADLGFSALDLVETHARFWDVHILGPEKVRTFEEQPRQYHEAVGNPVQTRDSMMPVKSYNGEQFDAAMTVSSYGEPYRRAIELWDSQRAVVMFPMAAYFALQSRHPLKTYKKIERVVREEVPRFGRAISIHDEWRRFFDPMQIACQRIALEESGSYLVPGRDVLQRSRAVGLSENQNKVFFLYRYVMNESERRSSQEAIDERFCFPGDPRNRGMLIGSFLPPRVIMVDDEWAPKPLIADTITNRLQLEGHKGVSYESLAAEAKDINRRVRNMRMHALIERLTDPQRR